MNINLASQKERLTKITKPRTKKLRKGLLKYGLLTINSLLVLGVAGFLYYGRNDNKSASADNVASIVEAEEVAVLDEISAGDIAANIAMAARLPEMDQVRNQADSRNALVVVPVSDDVVINKPQIITDATVGTQSRKDIIEYTSQDGDTIQSLAEKYNVTSDSIRWSNSLRGNYITPGTVLRIPPKNRSGIVYKVSASDSIDQLADKYKTTKEKIISFNDLELTNSLPVDQYIFIPDAEQPAEPVNNSYGNISIIANFVPRFGGNGYSFGYCTYWAAGRRAEVGLPIPSNWGNANTWDEYARASGYVVDNIPAVNAILQYDGGAEGIYHVAFVERVDADGTVVISEMNVVGWNRLSERTFTAAQAAAYDYIH